MTMVSRYHPALVVLHWVMALLIIAALALGALVMVKIPNTDPMKFEALRSHMAGGMAILTLMLIRLVIRSRSAHPAPASAGHPLLDREFDKRLHGFFMNCATASRCGPLMCSPHLVRRHRTSSGACAHSSATKCAISRSVRPAPKFLPSPSG